MVWHVQVKDVFNKTAKIRIEQNYKGLDPIWKSLTVGRFKVPVGICQNFDDGLLLRYDDAVRYGSIKYGQFKVVLLHDFWAAERVKINDLGNAYLYDEGVTNFEGGMAMWTEVSG
ncbi:MAG: hypothetical protein ABMA15_21990 [Vicinamibacterales bacterium]